MADQYPKRRHLPAQPAPVAESYSERDQQTEAEIEYTARQRALFLELFGEEGKAFIRDHYNAGLIAGWRDLHDVHLIDDAPIDLPPQNMAGFDQ